MQTFIVNFRLVLTISDAPSLNRQHLLLMEIEKRVNGADAFAFRLSHRPVSYVHKKMKNVQHNSFII